MNFPWIAQLLTWPFIAGRFRVREPGLETVSSRRPTTLRTPRPSTGSRHPTSFPRAYATSYIYPTSAYVYPTSYVYPTTYSATSYDLTPTSYLVPSYAYRRSLSVPDGAGVARPVYTTRVCVYADSLHAHGLLRLRFIPRPSTRPRSTPRRLHDQLLPDGDRLPGGGVVDASVPRTPSRSCRARRRRGRHQRLRERRACTVLGRGERARRTCATAL